MTDALKELAIRRRRTLQVARNADAILDHLEQMIRRTVGLGHIALIEDRGDGPPILEEPNQRSGQRDQFGFLPEAARESATCELRSGPGFHLFVRHSLY